MTAAPYGTDLFGSPYSADLPEFVHLCTAVVLGGEGGTLTLLGPVYGQAGEYMRVNRQVLGFDDDTDLVIYGDTTVEPVGPLLIPALDRLNPLWHGMVGVHVAPHLEDQIREALGDKQGEQARSYADWRLSLANPPMVCRRLFRNSLWWPDGESRDAFLVEGTLDQARQVLGRLALDHQVQVRDAADRPYAMVISRDGLYRYALPPIEDKEGDPWPPEEFEHVVAFEVRDLTELDTACLPDTDEDHPSPSPAVLIMNAALALFDRLQAEAHGNPTPAVNALAQVTWPVRVLMPMEGDEEYWVIREQAQGMEQFLWHGRVQDVREAVQLSVIMRNLLHWGSTDVAGGGYDGHLKHSLDRVLEVNGWEEGEDDVPA